MTVYSGCKISEVISVSSLYTFFKRRFPADYIFDGESHDFAEAVCVLDGNAGITADKDVFLLPPGKMIIHRPGEFHKIWSDGNEFEVIIFSFDSSVLPEKLGKVFSLSPEQAEEISSVHRLAGKAFVIEERQVKGVREGEEITADTVRKRLELFLLSVISRNNAPGLNYQSRSAENYRMILSVMEKHISSNPSVAEIAAMCRLSVPTVEQNVHKYSGKGVAAYFRELKLRRASELLEDGKSIKEVALMLGFANQNYFSAVFKKYKGVCPSDWRRQ